MTEPRPDPDPATWSDPRQTYDLVASAYAEKFLDELSHKPFDRDLLTRYAAELATRATPAVPVCDLGCGPGHIGAFLAERGVAVAGVDLSAAMVAVARQAFPGIPFSQGDMTAMTQADGAFSGIACFYAVVFVPRSVVPVALHEMHRTLAGGGQLLLSAHGGTESLHADEMLDQAVSLDATLFSLDELADLMSRAGFDIRETHERAPYEEELATQRLYIWATRRP